jgi:hypothetical protein
MLTYNLDTKALEVYDGTAWGPVVTAKEKRIEAFTGSGTWTVPAGVTYAIAHMLGGGGGGGTLLSRTVIGAASSVAFASGTVSGPGGAKSSGVNRPPHMLLPVLANTGQSAVKSFATVRGGNTRVEERALHTQWRAAAVTPAASITVTVGAGGSAGTSGAAGGSGYVYIEYYEEV